MASLILTEAELALETRRKNSIPNYMTRAAPLAGAYDEQKGREKQFPHAKRRNVGPCNTYNCHGLTFGSRRTEINAEIDKILRDDDYREIRKEHVCPGDIVLYYSDPQVPGGVIGDIEHSGIVLEKGQFGLLRILSKWGLGDEWVHFLADCPYSVSNVKFFRINDCPKPQAA